MAKTGLLIPLRVGRETKPGRYGDGLYLQAKPSGSKSWLFRYKQDGKTRLLGLGAFPNISLAAARKKAETLRGMRGKDIDPHAARETERERARLEAARAVTFQQRAETFIASREGNWKNAPDRKQWRNTLATYVYPILGKLPVAAIDAPLAALSALARFLAASPFNGSGPFSRPLEPLIANRGEAPRTDAGSGGVNARRAEHHVKAAAAFAADQLHGASGLTVDAAAARVAAALEAKRFPFGRRRCNPAKAVKAWRRDFAKSVSPAARVYQDHKRTAPLALSGSADAKRRAIMKWFGELLARAGYGAVA